MKVDRVGIVGYGVSIPYRRIKSIEIARAWDRFSDPGIPLGVSEKSVPNYDEDVITLSVESAFNAIKRADIEANQIGAIYIGSESHPYAVKPSSSVVAEALSLGNSYMAADTEFACKAGTAAMQFVVGLIKSGMVEYGMAIGSDCSQSAPGDALEYTAGAGSASFIFGKENIIAELLDTSSFTSDTPDFWRREGERYPRHAGRFTGEQAYFRHVENATMNFFDKTKTKAKDYDYCVFHMPNKKFPVSVASHLGFSSKQIEKSLVVSRIGNPYSASAMIGLANVLDNAKGGQSILVTSYGSGSGSDTFSFLTRKSISSVQKKWPTTEEYIKNKKYVSYTLYSRLKGNIKI